jgi:hypothetical protein
MTTKSQRRTRVRASVLACALGLGVAGTAAADDLIAPGAVTEIPGKGELPHRHSLLALSVGADVYAGDVTGADAVGELRFAEAIGIGLGAKGTGDGADGFVRMTGVGLAINHWAFLGYVDYAFNADQWTFGGAMVAPLRDNTYLRLSIAMDDAGRSSFGLGMEQDVW